MDGTCTIITLPQIFLFFSLMQKSLLWNMWLGFFGMLSLSFPLVSPVSGRVFLYCLQFDHVKTLLLYRQEIGTCRSYWALLFFMSWRAQGSNIAHRFHIVVWNRFLSLWWWCVIHWLIGCHLSDTVPIWTSFFIRYSSSPILWNIIKEGWHQRRTCWYLIFGSISRQWYVKQNILIFERRFFIHLPVLSALKRFILWTYHKAGYQRK